MKFRNANPLQIVGVLLGMLLHAFVWSADDDQRSEEHTSELQSPD